MIEISFKGAVDVGNNEEGILVGGQKFFQPSAFTRVDRSPFTDEDNLEYAVKHIFDRLAVGISTTNDIVKDGLYLIGNLAVSGDGSHTEMNVGEEKKIDSPVPYVMTLGMFAAIAVQKAFEQDPTLSEPIKLVVDMATGLPVKEFDREEGEKFAKRFRDHTYSLMVHLGYGQAVKVDVEFNRVKVVSEASVVVFSLQADEEGNIREGKIFEEFNERYSKLLKDYYDIDTVDGDFFGEKRLLHIDIGDGTTEFPITNDIMPDQTNSVGENRGIGHVINRNAEEIAKILDLKNLMRHNVSKILRDKTSIQSKRKRNRVIDAMEVSLKQEAENIKQIAINQLTKVQNEIDAVVVYGGGSILLKDHLEPILRKDCDAREIPVLYIPEEFAGTIYLEGLYLLLYTPVFEATTEPKASKTVKKEVKSK